jgi:uncharacterized protein
MVQKTDVSMQILKKFKTKVKKGMNLERLLLFGSRAKGTFSENSDFDLLVVSKDFEGIPLHKRAQKLYLTWSADIPVEFLCYTPQELDLGRAKAGGIISEAVRTGISV